MRDVQLTAENLSKRYELRSIFSHLSLSLGRGDILAITGRNGSGKSTLMKLLANVAERTSGSIRWRVDTNELSESTLPAHIGFVAPYLQLYGEFTAWEHVGLVQQLRGLDLDKEHAQLLFERFGLADRRHDSLSTFSSGMMQRVKFICAMVHSPAFLLLDEPTTNFDEAGIAAVTASVQLGSEDRITIVATNDPTDLRLCNKVLALA